MTSLSENCQICNESMASGKIFLCSDCSKKCHQECFFLCSDGEKKICKISKCDVCRYLEHPQEKPTKINCHFCKKSDGLLKRLKMGTKKNWTHIKCVKWFMKYIKIEEEGGNIIFTQGNNALPESTFLADCEECSKSSLKKKEVFLVKCNKDDCKVYLHPSCIRPTNITEESYERGFKYNLFKCNSCVEKAQNKKQNDIFDHIKSYGKNINTITVDKEANIKISEYISHIDQDVILRSVKPKIVDDGMTNNLKIKLQLWENESSQDREKTIINQKKRKSYSREKEFIGKKRMKPLSASDRDTYLVRSSLGKSAMRNKNKPHIRISSDYSPFTNDFPTSPVSEFNEPDNFVCTSIRCDICTLPFDDNFETNFKRCENCSTAYHLSCFKEVGEKESSNICKKCTYDKHMEIGCLVCNRSQGYMVKCDTTWVHIICALALKKYFYRKADQHFALGINNKPKNNKTCQICRMANSFTTTCQFCLLSFHPYCGFNAGFDFVMIDNKCGANYFARDLNVTCENHQLFLKKLVNKEALIKSPDNKENVLSTAGSVNKSINDKIKRISIRSERSMKKKRMEELQCDYSKMISSVNYTKLKKAILEDCKVDPYFMLKIKDWTWEVTDYFFLPIEDKIERLLRDVPNNERDELKDLLESTTTSEQTNTKNGDENDIQKSGIITCKFIKDNKEYICFYDINSLEDLKMHPEYINFYSELINLPPNDNQIYTIKSKFSKANKEDSVYYNINAILNKNIKIVNEEMMDVEKNQSNHAKNTRKKLQIDPLDDYMDSYSNTKLSGPFNSNSSEIVNVEKDESCKLNGGNNSSSNKMLKKIKLIHSFKLSRREKELLEKEKTAINKIKKEIGAVQFDQLSDVDKELFVRIEMLDEITNKNKELKYSVKTTGDDEENKEKFNYTPEESRQIISTFRSVAKFGYVKRRLMRGVEDKSLQELIKSRGQSQKYGKSISKDKEEFTDYMSDFYKSLSSSESECCVCFYSEFDDTIPIVFCDSCNVSVHAECYGLQEIPEGDYFCDLCVYNKRNSNKSSNKMVTKFNRQECVLCCSSKGAMKRLDKNGEYWAHVTCIFLSKSIRFKDYDLMNEVVGFNSKLLKSDKSCFYCNKSKGELFTCDSCEIVDPRPPYFHFFCAYLNGLKINIKEESTSPSNISHPHSKYFRRLSPLIECHLHSNERNRKEQKDLRELTYHKRLNEESIFDPKTINSCSVLEDGGELNLQVKESPVKSSENSENVFVNDYSDQEKDKSARGFKQSFVLKESFSSDSSFKQSTVESEYKKEGAEFFNLLADKERIETLHIDAN